MPVRAVVDFQDFAWIHDPRNASVSTSNAAGRTVMASPTGFEPVLPP